MSVRRVVRCVAEGLARGVVVRLGEVRLKEMEQLVALGIHAALTAMFHTSQRLCDAVVLCFGWVLAMALAARFSLRFHFGALLLRQGIPHL